MNPHEPAMIGPDYCRVMARYNRWMNERLYATIATLPDDERRRDRNAFFGSIHRTLNHLLWGDRMWLGRFIDEPCTAAPFGGDMYGDFAELAREREVTDRNMLKWAGSVSPEWLASTLVYTGSSDGRRREFPAAAAAMQLFNHGTHHRGQLTTLMKQAGCDVGVTDLQGMPGLVRLVD
jgi:uncharacterized damage-inducible protein DinB